ncbi:RnfABCDGE type electron transport complex subunit B [Clostridium polynesiense]|uniref:RnfABCDGE type electron transport complex subunit B n=1 Tax=Clostridium polynesiense TaxID=1325933 RepID=UPI000590470B|nr:Fe-S cluster domain-containing protein [Clostridium polynesiense]
MSNLVFPALSLGGLGLVFGVLLGYASKKFEVEVDPQVPLIREALPGANCGGCGFAGCDAFAQAVVDGAAQPNACSVGGAAVAEKIGEILGVSVDTTEKNIAFVKCNGDCQSSKDKYHYSSSLSCLEASMLPGEGAKSCSYGCLGLGSCVKVCKFDALHIVNGIAKVDETKCTACGACVNICPKNLIELVPESKKVRVSCNSKDKGKDVRENCSAGCIGCRLCEKNCADNAVHITDNLAKIDYDKCTMCGNCVLKCPTKAIKSLLS